MAGKAPGALYIQPGGIDDQLIEVHVRLGLAAPEHPPKTRCSVCSAALAPASPAQRAAGGLPPRIVEQAKEIWRCPDCGRSYWEGTHVASMDERLSRLRARLALPEGPKAPV